MSLILFDSIYPAQIPASGMDAVAGYVGGKWPTYSALVARFPNLPALSIAVNASQDAQCLDVETGDATPAQVPGWLDWQAKAHPDRTPILYCSATLMPAVRKAAGKRKYLLWSAHYNGQAHVCGTCGYPPADATQWADKGPHGETVDQTVMSPAFLAAFSHTAPPAQENDMDESRFINLIHEAADRNTPAGRQLGTYLQAATGVAGLAGQVAALASVVQQLAAKGGGSVDIAAVEKAAEQAVRNVLGSLDAPPAPASTAKPAILGKA
jgi:hypothetical protein